MAIDFKGRVAIVTGRWRRARRANMRWHWRREGPRWWSTILAARVMALAVPPLRRRRWWPRSEAAGGQAIASGASVTDFAAVQAMVQQTMDLWGRIDILVNNAGICATRRLRRWTSMTFGWCSKCT
jgi:NAD(P)-dependent dehydrogenase (short-subunit alcohol dehydrogenase family)